MINPSMVNGEVGRAVDRERVRSAAAYRATQTPRDGAPRSRAGGRAVFATVTGLVGRVFMFRSERRRSAATTGC